MNERVELSAFAFFLRIALLNNFVEAQDRKQKEVEFLKRVLLVV